MCMAQICTFMHSILYQGIVLLLRETSYYLQFRCGICICSIYVYGYRKGCTQVPTLETQIL